MLHSGEPIHLVNHVYSHDEITGENWIEGDRICFRWPEAGVEFAICERVFRNSDGDENDFYMVTDLGPHPFSVSR